MHTDCIRLDVSTWKEIWYLHWSLGPTPIVADLPPPPPPFSFHFPIPIVRTGSLQEFAKETAPPIAKAYWHLQDDATMYTHTPLPRLRWPKESWAPV